EEAVFGVMEAMARYRTEEQFRATGYPFRSFLHRVLAARLIDWLRQQNRQQRHLVLKSPLALRVAPGRVGDDRAGGSGGSSALLGAERGEVVTCLREGVAGPRPPAPGLWGGLAEGGAPRGGRAGAAPSVGAVH